MELTLSILISILLAYTIFKALNRIHKPGYVKYGKHTEVWVNRHGEVCSIRLSEEYVNSKEFKDKLLSDQKEILEDLRRQEDR